MGQVGDALADGLGKTKAIFGGQGAGGWVHDLGAQGRLHPAHRPIHKDGHAAAQGLRHPVIRRYVVSRNLRIFRPQRLRMIGPVNQRADGAMATVLHRQRDHFLIVYHGRTGVVNEALEVGESGARQVELRALHAAHRHHHGFNTTLHHKLVVGLVDARHAHLGPPQAHRVRAFVPVRGGDDDVEVAPHLLAGTLPDLFDIVEKEPDQVHAAEHDGLLPGGHGEAAHEQLIMYGGRQPVLAEARHIHWRGRRTNVGRNRPIGRARAKGPRHRTRHSQQQ